MSLAAIRTRLKRSLVASSGTIVFGMEDGTVSIFGLVFGVAATTTSSSAVLVAGATGAAAAAVSMMAGAFLDAETSRDEMQAKRTRLDADLAHDPSAIATLLSDRLATAGLMPEAATALTRAVERDRRACESLLIALQGPQDAHILNPREQALWMLLADFLSAAIPILPFALLPIPEARIVSATVTITLLIALGVGRARLGARGAVRTIAETVAIGIAAALAGVLIGVLVDRISS
jgi:VIT1/CCC1 family predicted Fe2+/Mn2+ transporter